MPTHYHSRLLPDIVETLLTGVDYFPTLLRRCRLESILSRHCRNAVDRNRLFSVIVVILLIEIGNSQ